MMLGFILIRIGNKLKKKKEKSWTCSFCVLKVSVLIGFGSIFRVLMVKIYSTWFNGFRWKLSL